MSKLSNDTISEMYLQMLRIRGFETLVEELFADGKIHGTTHLCIGQEAVPVGISAHLAPADLTVSNHRGHGHFLARGADTRRLFAELLGRQDGYCRGKGGTQHLSCLNLGHLGSNGITAGGLPVAAGAALSQKRKRTGAISVAYFGDGAVGEGYFHEAMNMASVWKLPVLFVCENNLYAMSTPVEKGIAGPSIGVKAAAYDMPWTALDGNDLLEVYEGAKRMISHLRSGAGPAFIEAKTYRFRGHSKSDKREYRTREEEKLWLGRDPLVRTRSLLLERNVPSESSTRLKRTSNAHCEPRSKARSKALGQSSKQRWMPLCVTRHSTLL
ncbi:MAG: thiamine pyrophosphate-dependent dehydrogenase E1 component subunit alpha [Planctomycetota bacterium]|nr:thiamine pyrophosphate-dependent dehydrogenase E1 component subunit alpha [Planctomycetota bacterium]